MNPLFVQVLVRDLRLAARRRIESLLPLAFFVVAVSLFPLGVGPEPQTLRLIAPGVTIRGPVACSIDATGKAGVAFANL